MARIYRSLESIDCATRGESVALAFGSFDGLHRAHRMLIARVREYARRHGMLSAVLSFSNHPLSVLAPPYAPKMLMTASRKIEILKQLDVDIVALPPFTLELSQQSAESFLETWLAGRLNLRHIVAGYDARFGKGGRGDGAMLKAESKRLGYTVEIMEPYSEGGTILGSRAIREMLSLGHVEQAAQWLERPHEMEGVVIPGDRRGRTIGFPTANLHFPPALLMPAEGVYGVWADVGGRRYGGMMNLGKRPTFGKVDLVPEVFLFGFDGDIYGEKLRVSFLRRLRGVERFAGLDALKEQLGRDREDALRALREFGESWPARN